MESALPSYNDFSGTLLRSLLADYQFAHASLIQAMAELDALTRGSLPSRDRVIDARWSISRASLTRRTLWSRTLTRLSSQASNELEGDLRRLQEIDMALLRASSEHVCKWPIEAVINDWSAYCAASRDIRRKMKAAIDEEKQVLYPALGGSSCGMSASHP